MALHSIYSLTLTVPVWWTAQFSFEPFTLLPAELQLFIFSFTSLSDRMRLLRCCSAFRALVDSDIQWRQLYSNTFGTLDTDYSTIAQSHTTPPSWKDKFRLQLEEQKRCEEERMRWLERERLRHMVVTKCRPMMPQFPRLLQPQSQQPIPSTIPRHHDEDFSLLQTPTQSLYTTEPSDTKEVPKEPPSPSHSPPLPQPAPTPHLLNLYQSAMTTALIRPSEPSFLNKRVTASFTAVREGERSKMNTGRCYVQ